MPTIKSRVNGLLVSIPADARGILNRFATRGGNELVFEEIDKRSVVPASKVEVKKITEQNERMASKNAAVRQAAIAASQRSVADLV